MKKFDIVTLPNIRFAHTHEADSYNVSFKALGDRIEVLYVAEGQICFKKGNVNYIAEKGDIICHTFDSDIHIKADAYHCHHTVSANVFIRETDNSNGLYLPYLIKASKETEVLKEMIDFCIYKPYKYENSSTKEAKIFLDILCKIDEISRKEKTFSEKGTSIWAEKAKAYIHQNIKKPLTQTEVANHLGISTGYLCNVFKKSENISVIKYINTTKLKSIDALMQKEKIKLYEAAYIYGYNDANYVSALYKKMFGHNISTEFK